LNGAQLDALFMGFLDLTPTDAAYKFFAASKKGAKVEDMHKLFHDPEVQLAREVTAEQKARIDAWVPDIH
jgi:ParB family chromosome partitioning protein